MYLFWNGRSFVGYNSLGIKLSDGHFDKYVYNIQIQTIFRTQLSTFISLRFLALQLWINAQIDCWNLQQFDIDCLAIWFSNEKLSISFNSRFTHKTFKNVQRSTFLSFHQSTSFNFFCVCMFYVILYFLSKKKKKNRYMIESPRWLVNRGRLSEAAFYLNRIAKINNKTIEIDEKYLKSMLPANEPEKIYGMLSLFNGFRLAKHTTILILCW